MKTGIAMLACAAGATLCGAQLVSAATITNWDFQNVNTVGATGNSVTDTSHAPTIGSGTASTLGMTNSYPTPGPSMDISDVFETTGTADQGSSDPTAPALNNIWRVRGGQVTGNAQAGNGWSSLAPVDTQGAQFAVSTAGFNGISVSFDWYPTKRGAADLEAQYTTDGTNWTTALDLHAATSAWFNQNTFTAPAAANNDPNFAIRMVNQKTGAAEVDTTGAALNNSSGNWRFDEVTISGTSAPEPTSLGLLGLGSLAMLRRRRA